MPFSHGSGSNAVAVGGRSSALGTAIAGLLVLLFVTGCRSTPKPPTDEAARAPAPYARPQDDAVPAWLGEPLSWEKLARVEAWLGNEGRSATPQWRNEAELVLNSGRLEFARRELERSTERDADKEAARVAAVAPRLRTAKGGFDRLVLRDDLNAGQRKRAEDGAARAERLLARTPVAKKATSMPLVARADWGAMKAKPGLMDRTVGAYSRITVHHSADNDPVVLDGSAARTYEAMRDIQRAHMNGKETHYGDIGYHFVIDPYGRVLEGRELAYQGAHAKGDNNVRNIGICLIGNFDEEKPTDAALTALRRLIDDLRTRYSIARNMVYGHRDLRSTRCPGENLARWVISYRGGPPGAVTAQAAAPRRPARTGR
ncbi:MAG: peptidoglycan recognition family protein [Planctomycetota bacterium]|nr:peptidoglycan recognition family protein [Planctomycetota bacterium]